VGSGVVGSSRSLGPAGCLLLTALRSASRPVGEASGFVGGTRSQPAPPDRSGG